MKEITKRNVRSEVFTSSMLQRVPKDIGSSFTDQQLIAISDAMQFKNGKLHPLDLRGTFRIWNKEFYFVALGGTEQRGLTRRQKTVLRHGEILLLSGLSVMTMVTCITVLYLIKSVLGIDIFENRSLGVWDWLRGKID